MSPVEELVECPYNRTHRIMPHAMQRHLYKCRKNNPSSRLACCPFNSVHRVPKPELTIHIANCKDRATFDLYKYCISSVPSTDSNNYRDQGPELIYNNEAPQVPGKTLQDDDECWDDSNEPAYNPQQYCEQAKVIRKATLMKPSEKKRFYQQEHQRLRELDAAMEEKNRQFKRSGPPVPESKYYNNGSQVVVPEPKQFNRENTRRPRGAKPRFNAKQIDEINDIFANNLKIRCA